MGNRDIVILECGKCKRRNYSTDKNKKLHSGRIEHVKFCPYCNSRTKHKETR